MAAIFLSLLLSSALPTEPPRRLEPGAASPAAAVSALDFLAGTWVGGREGREATIVYTRSYGGQISGHFQEARDGKVMMYEIVQIVPAGASLAYRLKHFNPDLSGWEDKAGDAAIVFPLVAIEKDAAYFDGFTIRRTGPDTLEEIVRITTGDGGERLLHYRYRRQPY